MKFAFGLFAFIWVMSGLIGAWMLDDLNPRYWKVVAKGPITLSGRSTTLRRMCRECNGAHTLVLFLTPRSRSRQR